MGPDFGGHSLYGGDTMINQTNIYNEAPDNNLQGGAGDVDDRIDENDFHAAEGLDDIDESVEDELGDEVMEDADNFQYNDADGGYDDNVGDFDDRGYNDFDRDFNGGGSDGDR